MIFAAILAGGVGNRMGLNHPKQFELINNKPILIYSVEQFLKVNEIEKIIVSSPKSHIMTTKNIINQFIKDKDRIIVIEGGITRNDTILNSIEFIKKNYDDEDPILITHDAARIFVTTKLIKESIKQMQNYDAASPVIPAIDVIFKSEEKGKLSIPLRKNLYHSQTPQSFKINKFLNIYDTLKEDEINKLDEAMMLFFLRNGKISLFEGDPNNFKITRNIDLNIAKTYISHIKH